MHKNNPCSKNCHRGGRNWGRFRAPPAADTARNKEWQRLGDWQATNGLRRQSLSLNRKRSANLIVTRCGAIGSALALGARCCRFESCHFDQRKIDALGVSIFLLLELIGLTNRSFERTEGSFAVRRSAPSAAQCSSPVTSTISSVHNESDEHSIFFAYIFLFRAGFLLFFLLLCRGG